MADSAKITFVSDVEVTTPGVEARRPFTVKTDNRRRFIRLEISAPMSVRRVKDVLTKPTATNQDDTICGHMLNMSGGGVLVELQDSIDEGDIVLMEFSLQGSERLTDVLGIVKRCDGDEDVYLVGIAFTGRSQLMDKLSASELELLGETPAAFGDRVLEVLSQYLIHENKEPADA